MKSRIEIYYRHAGANIKRRRRELRMTQAELAERSALNRASIANIEAGRQRFTSHVFESIARSLMTSVADLSQKPVKK